MGRYKVAVKKEDEDMAQVNGLWANQLQYLKSKGITESQI